MVAYQTTKESLAVSEMDLVVAGSKDAVMIVDGNVRRERWQNSSSRQSPCRSSRYFYKFEFLCRWLRLSLQQIQARHRGGKLHLPVQALSRLLIPHS